jgi:hypothetical protein
LVTGVVSFGKIFSDLMGSVAARGGKAIFEDVVEFLETQVTKRL